jgi:GH24 family phage-related lysozyme (muramidase)
MTQPKPNNNKRLAAGAGAIIVAGSALVAGSPQVMDFLERWEGREYKVYADQFANGLPTVCKGLTKHITDTPIIVGEVWAKDKCEREEKAALIKVQMQLAPCFRLPPAQIVFDAATSFAWNVGAPSVCKSGAMQAWNAGQWDLGCQRISRSDGGKLVWVFAGGKFVKGLANRRAAETNWCLKWQM